MDNKFGMFIHWGLYAIVGTHEQCLARDDIEHGSYTQLIKQFNPTEYDPEEWVITAKNTGMKYICFTTKHHDGFCMWDTKYTDYNIMNTPSFKRANKLLEASYYLGYANALTKGALYDFSSETVTAKLYGKVGGYISLLISLKVLGVYDIAFYGGKKLLQVPDYNARAEEFSSLYNLPNSQVVDGLLAQLKVLKKGKSKKTLAIRALKSEIKSNLKLQSVILDTFSVLGGKTEPIDKCKLANALKHGGDAPFFLNGLSVAREQGVLELIK